MLAGFAAAISGGAQGFDKEEAAGGGQAGKDDGTGAIILTSSLAPLSLRHSLSLFLDYRYSLTTTSP